MANEKVKETSVGGIFRAAARKVNAIGLRLLFGKEDAKKSEALSAALQTGFPARHWLGIPENTNAPQTSTAIVAAQEAYKIGEPPKDGTVLFAVNLKDNVALFVPASIFGGEATFDNQNAVVEKVNAGDGLHGHTDWRRATDNEAGWLAQAWDKVVAPFTPLHFNHPRFWAESVTHHGYGRVFRGGVALTPSLPGHSVLPVPVVRSVPIIKSLFQPNF